MSLRSQRIAPRVFRALIILHMAGLGACSFDASFEKLVIGKSYETAIRAGNGGGQIPLPEGEWIVAGWDFYTDRQALGGVLVQTEGRRVARLLDFYVPYHTEGRKLGLKLAGHSFCARRDVLFVTAIKRQLRSSYGGDTKDNCWGVDHRPMTFYGKVPKHLLALRDYVESNGLELPVTMLAVKYRRRDGGPNKFSLDYYFNPELDGFDPPQQVDWRTGDWHRDRAFRDPKKKAYVEKLIKWGESWEGQVERGFRGLLKRGGS